MSENRLNLLQLSAFIYTMPGYNCSIKNRMLYSSCKKAVTDVIESLGIEIHKKVCADLYCLIAPEPENLKRRKETLLTFFNGPFTSFSLSSSFIFTENRQARVTFQQRPSYLRIDFFEFRSSHWYFFHISD